MRSNIQVEYKNVTRLACWWPKRILGTPECEASTLIQAISGFYAKSRAMAYVIKRQEKPRIEFLPISGSDQLLLRRPEPSQAGRDTQGWHGGIIGLRDGGRRAYAARTPQ